MQQLIWSSLRSWTINWLLPVPIGKYEIWRANNQRIAILHLPTVVEPFIAQCDLHMRCLCPIRFSSRATTCWGKIRLEACQYSMTPEKAKALLRLWPTAETFLLVSQPSILFESSLPSHPSTKPRTMNRNSTLSIIQRGIMASSNKASVADQPWNPSVLNSLAMYLRH